MKPSIPKGTRDFSPAEMVKRNFIFDTIKSAFQSCGYQQIETPAMENLSVLEGKYGEEGDRLLFRILNSGSLLETLKTANAGMPSGDITEKGLRYDLTVPFARYVVQHQNEISFPFKRFQVQPVWRADRPQKGRYREFYQCDADVIGSDSLLNEVELVQIISEVFTQLKIKVSIKLNNRKILSGIAEVIGEKDKIIDITVAIDKLDKIGLDKVNEELKGKGLPEKALAGLQPILNLSGSHSEKLAALKNILAASETGLTGIAEMQTLFDLVSGLASGMPCELDLTLARGLNYYTGTIIEVKADDPRSTFTSSVCGGGRYDDLTGIFGLKGMSGVGISFGADRIYDVMEEAGAFPDFSNVSTKILFVNFGDAEARYCLGLVGRLRKEGIHAELFPDTVKMAKQMKYADAKKIPFVALVGGEEMKTGNITVKTMGTGEQNTLNFEELLHLLKR